MKMSENESLQCITKSVELGFVSTLGNNIACGKPFLDYRGRRCFIAFSLHCTAWVERNALCEH